jgi:hypothetical protein
VMSRDSRRLMFMASPSSMTNRDDCRMSLARAVWAEIGRAWFFSERSVAWKREWKYCITRDVTYVQQQARNIIQHVTFVYLSMWLLNLLGSIIYIRTAYMYIHTFYAVPCRRRVTARYGAT